MTYCVNCRQDHAVEATEEHQAPCLMCDSDGHARCQHGDATIPCVANCGRNTSPGYAYCLPCERARQEAL
jgi:hypothetical protein